MPSKLFSKPCKSKKPKPEKFPQPIAPLKDIVLSKFRQQCLDEHNRYRKLHCCPPLKFCPELNNMALQWAIHLAHKNCMEARHFDNHGENLYVAEKINITGDVPVNRWYSEIENYEFATSIYTTCASHFTQVIWKSTKEIGVGVCQCGEKTYVVVNYYPPGNITGRFRENVPRRPQ